MSGVLLSAVLVTANVIVSPSCLVNFARGPGVSLALEYATGVGIPPAETAPFVRPWYGSIRVHPTYTVDLGDSGYILLGPIGGWATGIPVGSEYIYGGRLAYQPRELLFFIAPEWGIEAVRGSEGRRSVSGSFGLTSVFGGSYLRVGREFDADYWLGELAFNVNLSFLVGLLPGGSGGVDTLPAATSSSSEVQALMEFHTFSILSDAIVTVIDGESHINCAELRKVQNLDRRGEPTLDDIEEHLDDARLTDLDVISEITRLTRQDFPDATPALIAQLLPDVFALTVRRVIAFAKGSTLPDLH